MDTIFALSSGAPPAGIAIVRVTGPQARAALQCLCGNVPPPRLATRATLRNAEGVPLDDGLVLFFPSPRSVTGEDLAEFHLHGGRAVIEAVQQALQALPGLRRAEAGEFTRRAFANGRIDLAQAEGLADLLAAETELQRRAAITNATGALSRQVEDWRERLLLVSAQVEAILDFDDEDDVTAVPEGLLADCAALYLELERVLSKPAAEPLREGYRIAIAGPPNAGKSTLFNCLIEREAAIATPIAGTTRDVLVQSVAIEGVPFQFIDMAGLREDSEDPIEAVGIARARSEIGRADLVLWLGAEGEGPVGAWEIEAQCDRPGHASKASFDHRVSALTGEGIAALTQALLSKARTAMPAPGDLALNRRQRELLAEASVQLRPGETQDLLILAEHLRRARLAFDRLLGRTSTEDLLDALFGRFCIGK